jgi:secondary thiamine-phosphate synthase enzyme
MLTFDREITIKTNGEVNIIDITAKVEDVVRSSKFNNGLACVFVPGSTGAVTTIEYEPGLLTDLPRALERLFPKNMNYEHQKMWHDGNGHSHVRAAFMGPSITVPFKNRKLILGTWQQIVFVELDVRPRTRKLIVQLVGS